MELELTYYFIDAYFFLNFVLISLYLIFIINFISSIKNEVSLKEVMTLIVSLIGIVSFTLFCIYIIAENVDGHSLRKYYTHPELILIVLPIISLLITLYIIYKFIKNKFFIKK